MNNITKFLLFALNQNAFLIRMRKLQQITQHLRSASMKIISDLISTDYGLMSFIVIVVIALAMIGFAWFAISKAMQ